MPVLFCDLDDTLIERTAAFRSWITDFAQRHELERAWVDRIMLEDQRGFRSREELFDVAAEITPTSVSIDDLIAEFHDLYPFYFPPIADEIRAELIKVRASGWRVVVLTNGAPAQERKIRATGTDAFVDGWCISDVLGVRKPDPAIFLAGAALCGETLDGAWMIGDSPEADIGGAKAASIQSAWIRLGRRWPLDDFEPDMTVDSVAEAIGLIREQSPA